MIGESEAARASSSVEAPTIEGLRAVVKRYRAGELEATGELVRLGTTHVDDLARAYGLERAPDDVIAQLAEIRESKGDDGVAARVARHVESHAKSERAAARAMELRAVRVLCPRRDAGEWVVDTSEVVQACDVAGRFVLVAWGDDVWTMPRTKVRHLPDLLAGCSSVSWRIEARSPSTPILVCSYRTSERSACPPSGRRRGSATATGLDAEARGTAAGERGREREERSEEGTHQQPRRAVAGRPTMAVREVQRQRPGPRRRAPLGVREASVGARWRASRARVRARGPRRASVRAITMAARRARANERP